MLHQSVACRRKVDQGPESWVEVVQVGAGWWLEGVLVEDKSKLEFRLGCAKSVI